MIRITDVIGAMLTLISSRPNAIGIHVNPNGSKTALPNGIF